MGVSFDSPAQNETWAEAEGMTFDLWSDDQRELALYYGAATSPTQRAAARKTVILDENGTLVLEYPIVATGTTPQYTLEDCQALFGGG